MEYVCDVSLWSNLLQEHGYELLGQLDSGSFSDVFAVRSVTNNRVLAVKRMVARREISHDPRILKEIACLRQLMHIGGACVIRLEGTIWRLDRLACLVLELAPMGDLERHTAEHWPLPTRLVTSAVRQVLSALAHCHRLRIAHRDINPANVLLMSEHSVRLADFGLAFHCRDPSSGRRILCDDYLGRDSYLAPEALLCTPYDAMQADMWSMSSLCLFILTGKHPPPNASTSSSSAYSSSSMDDCADGGEVSVDKGLSPGTSPGLQYDPHPAGSSLVKQSLSLPRSKPHSHRCSSHDSEGSCRSESDVEEALPRSSLPETDCPSPRSSDGDVCCQWDGAPSSVVVEEDVFKRPTVADCAVVHLISKLRVEEPSLRLPAEDALKLWKDISSWPSKSFGIS